MKLPEMPFTALDWSVIEPVEVPGATGTSYWRSFEVGDLRVRIVDYGPEVPEARTMAWVSKMTSIDALSIRETPYAARMIF